MKNILRFLFVVSCLFVTMSPLHAQWVQNIAPSGVTFRSFAVSNSNLFAGTESGCYLSTDSGTSWTALGLAGYYAVYALVVSGPNLFGGTYGDGVFLSTNNGTSWTAVNTGLTKKYVYALAVSGTNLFAGTDGGVFLSTNNGASWTAVNTGLSNITGVGAFAVSGTNLFAGTSGGVYLSTNNGASWVSTGLTQPYVYAFAFSGTNLFAATNSGVYLSTNNGTSWTAVNTGLTNNYVHALAVSGTNLFAGTDGKGVFLSTNNGTSWTAVNTGLRSLMVEALAVFGTNLFAGTYSGGVWRRLLSEMVTSVEKLSTDLPTSYCLHQNYPNPFNPSTKIQFSIPNTSFVSLKVFNVLGAETATLVDENKAPGTYQVTWDANGYPSGVYFYRLMSAGKVFTGKMNLLK